MVYGAVHLLSLCAIVVATLCLSLGAYCLRSNPGERTNQLFSLICLGFFFWSFALAFLPGAPDTQHAWLWFKVSALGWAFAPALLLHFLLLLSGQGRWLRRTWVLWGLYLPAVSCFALALFGDIGVVDFVATPFGWSEVYGPATVGSIGYLAYVWGFLLFGLAQLWRWGRQSTLVAERRQSRLLIATGLPFLAAVVISGTVLPWLGIRNAPEVAHLIAAGWLLVIWYSMAAYRRMLLTPASVASNILQTMADAVLVLNREHRIISVNDAAENLLGATRHELEQRSIQDLFGMEDDIEAAAVEDLLSGRRIRNLELEYRTEADHSIPVMVSASGVVDRFDQTRGQVLLLRDLRAQKKTEAELEHLATHDALTGLPNRSILHDRLERALDRAGRERKPFALLMFDLDEFKAINDTYGQKVGDIVLQSTSKRLRQCVRGLDTVCRLGGDEFMVVVEDLLESGDSDIVARRIQRAFDEPIGTGAHAVSVSATVGISTYPFDGLDPETLVKKANLALSSAKEKQKGGFQYYAPRMDAINRERTRIEQGLRLALTRDELHLVYQPLVELETGQIAGFEALLRWRSQEMGLVGPIKFIPVAERCGLIVPIGQWVLETACKVNRSWQDAGLPRLPMSVNISAKQLQQDDFVEVVEATLKKSGLSPHLLELELTESTAMHNVRRSQEILSRLKDLGVRIVIDDFGTGYSSLVRLKLLPMDAVKVDRSFIENIAKDPRDRALVMAIVALARNLGVEVVAEGVETREQLEVLRSFEGRPVHMFRFDKIQGHLFSAPVARDEIPDLIARQEHQDRTVWTHRPAADGRL